MPINLTTNVQDLIPDGSQNAKLLAKLNGAPTVIDYVCQHEAAEKGHGPTWMFKTIDDDGADWQVTGEAQDIQTSVLNTDTGTISRTKFTKAYEPSYESIDDISRNVDLIAKAIGKGATRRDQTLDRTGLALLASHSNRTNLGAAQSFGISEFDSVISTFEGQEPEGDNFGAVLSRQQFSDLQASLSGASETLLDLRGGIEVLAGMFMVKPGMAYKGLYRGSIHVFMSTRLANDAEGDVGGLMVIGEDSEGLTEVTFKPTLVEIDRTIRNQTFLIAMSGMWGYGIENAKQVLAFASRDSA